MYTTSDIRNGLKIELHGEPFEVLDFLHSKHGRGGAHIWTKLRNMRDGSVIEHTFRSGEKIAKPDLESRDMQYLYQDDAHLVFMDMTSFDQMNVSKENLGAKAGYLTEGQEVKVLTYEGQIIDVNLPPAVVLQVVEAEPGVKGDTVSGAVKPAKLETGLTVNVPLFVESGHRIKVDTRSGTYLGRE